MRYTETKLGRIAQFLTEDLEKNTVGIIEVIMMKQRKNQRYYLLNTLTY